MSEETKIVSKNKVSKRTLIIVVTGIAIVLIILFAILLPKAAEAKKLEEQLDLGAKYLSELQYEQAVAAYLTAIEIDPKNVDAYLGLADAYVAMGEYEKAIAVLEDALNELSGDAAETVRKKLDEVRDVKTAAGVILPTIQEDSSSDTVTPYQSKLVIDHIVTAQIGDVVKFGRYLQGERDFTWYSYQTVSVTDEIEWYVLDRKEDKVLLFSKYVLDGESYHEEYTEVTWAQSSIREWLNKTFYNIAFSEEEKNYICKTKLLNNDNAEYGSEGGESTIDNVFLLSIEEAREYFNYTFDNERMVGFEEYKESELDERLIGLVTYYAIKNGSPFTTKEGSTNYPTHWYLRSMGMSNLRPVVVTAEGKINTDEYPIYYVDRSLGIRPAIWVDVSGKSNDGDILDLTGGVAENVGRIFHSLKANPENLLSFDELNFLGHSIVNLDVDTVQRLLKENNYSVSVSDNSEWKESNDDYIWFVNGTSEYPFIGMPSISAHQDATEGYVSYLDYTQYTHNNEVKSPVGVRNIQMHDTLGEALDKIGFSNAYEYEADMEYFFSEYCNFENDISDEKYWIFDAATEYNCYRGFAKEIDGLAISSDMGHYDSMTGEVFEIELTLSDTLFEKENGDKRYLLFLKFELDENTNEKFILTKYTMYVLAQ